MRRAGLIRLAALALFVALLEATCRAGMIGRFTMVPPSEMVTGLYAILADGRLNEEMALTLGGVLTASVAAIAAGFLLGLLLHALPRVRRCLDPLLATYYSVPIYVFYPMFLVFFGMNRIPIVVIGFLFAVVAMMTSTLNGLDRVPRVMRKTARVMRLGRLRTTALVVLPSAAPYIFSGIKLAVAYSFVGVLGAEFILSNSGLGYQISLAFNNFDNVAMYSMILLVVVVISTVNSALFGWERRIMLRRGQR